MNHRLAIPATPLQPFFTTPEQRLALARERYFDDGVRPSGLVSEGVIQSWSRCVQGRRDPVEQIAFNPVTPSRIHSALGHSRLLLKAAAPDLRQLECALAETSTTAILTDPNGVVVHSTRSVENPGEVLLPLARRVGVSLDEEHIGTGAPGVTLRTGQACTVLGGEHFFGHLQVLHCAAAPIRDIHGHLAAVLDVTCELRPFGFDAAAVVALYATAIENRLLRAQSTEHIVVRLQTSPTLLDTPLEGLLGVTSNGHLAWLNGAAARLLGIGQPTCGLDVEGALGLDLRGLNRLTRQCGPTPHRLPSGLNVWLLGCMQSHDGAAGTVYGGSGWMGPRDGHTPRPRQPESTSIPVAETTARLDTSAETLRDAPVLPSAAPADGRALTLRDTDRHLVEQTVNACNGNVSQAARRLGVSRGLVYRHLKHARTR